MSTTKRKPPPRPPAPAPTPTVVDPGEQLDPSGDPADVALSAMMSELAGTADAKVTAYRYKKNEPLSYLFKCHPEAFSLDELRDKYNGGEFKLYIARDGGLWRTMVISVEPPARITHEMGGPPANADITIAMREGFERQAKQLSDAIAALRPTQPALDIPALLMSATSMITALRQASEPSHPPAPAPAPPTPQASIESMISLLQKGVELGRDITPGAAGPAGDAGFIGLIRDLIRSPMLGTVLEAARAQTAAAVPIPAPPPRATQPAPAAVAVPTPQPSAGVVMLTEPQLRWIAQQLVPKARNNSNPGLYAEYILDNAPPGQVRAFVLQPDAIEQLVRVNPEVQIYRQWFDALRLALLQMLETEGDTGLTTQDARVNGTGDAARSDAADVPGPTT